MTKINRNYQNHFIFSIILYTSLVAFVGCGGSSGENKPTPPAENTMPTISISSPSNNSEFDTNVEILLIANASDQQDGDISNNITWNSSLDGALSSGANISVFLSAGTHSVTASIIDSGSLSAESSIVLTINQATGAISVITDSNSDNNEAQEYATTGTTIGITALATDPGDTITYSLLDDAGGRFTIDSGTGVVTVDNGDLLEANLAQSHSIQVQAQSTDSSTSSNVFSISVIDDGCPVKPNETSIAAYTLSWDQINDTDLTGFNIYFSNNPNLNKNNSQGSIAVSGNETSTMFIPSNHNILTCQSTYIAVSSVGSRPESALSEIQSIVVE